MTPCAGRTRIRMRNAPTHRTDASAAQTANADRNRSTTPALGRRLGAHVIRGDGAMMKLIFDVGVCDGADSAYYLTQADKVVGVEASPVACAALRKRFEAEIAEGRYVLE